MNQLHVWDRLSKLGTAPRMGAIFMVALALAACSSDAGDGDDDGAAGTAGGATGGSSGGSSTGGSNTGGSNTGGSSAGGSSTGGGTTCTSCDDGCPNIPCACQDGSIVNTTFCDNGCCAPAEVACPDSCADNGGWVSGGTGGTGGSGGGETGGSGGGSSGNDVGGECQGDDDCITKICLFKSGASFGYCSMMCESFADCPTFWDCTEVGNASGTYCVQD